MTCIERFSRSLCCTALVAMVYGPVGVCAQDTAVATIGKQTITAQDLANRTQAKLKSMHDGYELHARELKLNYERASHDYQEKELRALVDAKVLALEAAKTKTTPVALLDALKTPTLTDAQIHAFYDSQKTQINQPFDSVAPQIKEYLGKQAAETARRQYLGALKAKYHASVTFEPLRETVAATGPERGPANAPVTIVEFSDFQCPFCGRFAPVIKRVVDQYPTQVRLVYRHLPLTNVHPEAQKAAEAAVCANDQGKFWEMHDLLFSEQTSLSVGALKEKSHRLGLDTKTFDECVDSGKAAATIAADVQAANDLGISGTPTSFINGRYTNGAVAEIDLTDMIDDELRRAGSMARR